MRIQHNIMAMNAYRNYTNNVSAMKKNLERLSSGYKINRAGDDAAGLAISEKMRAQITGLETAQKNAKDGISLVQTAEGALTEVHDMLNRMVELATQSANGTYDNDTDRYQLQKELEQLKDEINRIADSSNFNGIKLLDGSMDTTSISGVDYTAISDNKVQKLFVNQDDWDGATQNDVDNGINILETEGGQSSKASFDVSLENITLNNVKDGDVFQLKIGDYFVTTDALKAGDYTSAQLAEALNGKELTVQLYDENDNNVGEAKFTVTANGSVLSFNIDEDNTTEFSVRNLGEVTWSLISDGDVELDDVTSPNTDVVVKETSMEIDLTGLTANAPGDITIKVSAGGRAIKDAYEFTVSIDWDDILDDKGTLDLEKVGAKLVKAMQADNDFMALFGANPEFTVGEDGKVTISITDGSTQLDPTEWESYKTTAKVAGSDSDVDEVEDDDGMGITGKPTVEVTNTGSTGTAAITIDLTGLNVEKAGTITVTVFGETYEIEITEEDIANKETTSIDKVVAKELAKQLTAAKLSDASGAGSLAVSYATGATTITLTAAKASTAFVDDVFAKPEITVTEKTEAKGIQPRVVRAGVLRASDTNFRADDSISDMDDAVVGGTLTTATATKDIDWTLETSISGNTDLVGKNVSVTIGNDTFTVTIASAGAVIAENDFTQVALSAGSETGQALLERIAEALQKQFSAKADEYAEGTDNYTAVTVLKLNGNGSGTITATYTATPYTYIGDDDGSDEPKVEELEAVTAVKGVAGVDFADESNWDTPLNTIDSGILTALKDAGTITLGEGDDEIKVDLGSIFTAWDGTESLGAALDEIQKAVEEKLGEWNDEHPDSDYEYVFVRFEAGPDQFTRGPGDALQIVIGKQARETPEQEVGSKIGGYIDGGIQNPHDNVTGASAQVANTKVNFGDYWADGAKITIGDTTYTVALGQDSKFKNVTNVIDLTDLTSSSKDFEKIAAQRLAAAAKDNGIFIVGHDGKGNTTLQQRLSVKESTDMSTKEKLASYLGVSVADANSITTATPGKALTLQIGDTADSYNQLKVSIGDAHTAALGLDGISIADQDSAAAAIDKIKAAINTVSDIRGTLGATQNRLDHTINNLSVMTENIQDAESTIRDTDIAEEMMAYTKNNILIQSAQAMLAQANQVPQGVLQLLQ